MPFVILIRRRHLDNMTFFRVPQMCHTKEGEQYIIVHMLITFEHLYASPWALTFYKWGQGWEGEKKLGSIIPCLVSWIDKLI